MESVLSYIGDDNSILFVEASHDTIKKMKVFGEGKFMTFMMMLDSSIHRIHSHLLKVGGSQLFAGRLRSGDVFSFLITMSSPHMMSVVDFDGETALEIYIDSLLKNKELRMYE